jgi:hypothetical protein
MVKQWTKTLPSGMSVIYSYVETEFEISATALIKRTRQVYSRVLPSAMTRDEIEREFRSEVRSATWRAPRGTAPLLRSKTFE